MPFGTPSIIVRVRGTPAEQVAAVRAALQGMRSDMPFILVRPLAEELHNEMLPYQLGAMLFSLFGVLALALAALAVAFAGTRYLASLLFGVEPLDPLSFTMAALFLVCVALMATLLPAWRAARLDPLIALREE